MPFLMNATSHRSCDFAEKTKIPAMNLRPTGRRTPGTWQLAQFCLARKCRIPNSPIPALAELNAEQAKRFSVSRTFNQLSTWD
jgi:hypothetical protein